MEICFYITIKGIIDDPGADEYARDSWALFEYCACAWIPSPFRLVTQKSPINTGNTVPGWYLLLYNPVIKSAEYNPIIGQAKQRTTLDSYQKPNLSILFRLFSFYLIFTEWGQSLMSHFHFSWPCQMCTGSALDQHCLPTGAGSTSSICWQTHRTWRKKK